MGIIPESIGEWLAYAGGGLGMYLLAWLALDAFGWRPVVCACAGLLLWAAMDAAGIPSAFMILFPFGYATWRLRANDEKRRQAQEERWRAAREQLASERDHRK